MKINRIEHMCEGNGHVIIKELLDEQQLNGKCGLYAEVTLEPGCSLGFHMHYGESETYYILTGEGEYNDNGTSWRHVKAGDITFYTRWKRSWTGEYGEYGYGVYGVDY
ncbi:MAG: cupin domain-containing protein [Ruminococcus sp.]